MRDAQTDMKTHHRNFAERTGVTALCVALMAGSLNSCRSMSDSTATLAGGTGLGALAGGAVGTGIGALVGGKDRGKAMAIGAIAGAVVGGIIGNRWGASVVKKKEAYASTEQYIQANIEQMDTRIAQASKLQTSLKNQIASLKQQKSTLALADYNKIRTDIARKNAYISTDIENATLAMNDKESTETQREKLRAQIAQLTDIQKSLTSDEKELGSLAARA